MRPTMTTRILSTLALTFTISISIRPGPRDTPTGTSAARNQVDQCCLDLAKAIDFKTPDLWIGSAAPKLSLAQFVKGESVNGFEKDHVYVVEFWATWCGPCRAAFPHLSEMQKKFTDKATFVGVNIWDKRDDETEAQRIDRVTEFVKGQGARMG
ncbi:MAG: thioredoxin family protein [Phycisphaerales bacterium]